MPAPLRVRLTLERELTAPTPWPRPGGEGQRGTRAPLDPQVEGMPLEDHPPTRPGNFPRNLLPEPPCWLGPAWGGMKRPSEQPGERCPQVLGHAHFSRPNEGQEAALQFP